jgi:hypothetical protein
MLEVELDVFSGVPNPTWTLSPRQEAGLYERLRADSRQISSATKLSPRLGLGYRGLIVRRIKTDDGPWDRALAARRTPFANEFRLGLGQSKKDSAADWLVRSAGRQGVELNDEVRKVVSRGVAWVPQLRGPRDPKERVDRKRVPEDKVAVDTPYALDAEHHETWWACGSNLFSANASYFNDPAHVTRNNCYCFASNHMPDIRYARPGRRGGHPATALTCGACIDGLHADGWKEGCEPNALTIVMVMWPGNDYHFYRLVTGGPYWWWGHKPGGTPARYTDDCGHGIYQYQGKGYAPNNICRAPYTDFCGYFYQNNNTAYVA